MLGFTDSDNHNQYKLCYKMTQNNNTQHFENQHLTLSIQLIILSVIVTLSIMKLSITTKNVLQNVAIHTIALAVNNANAIMVHVDVVSVILVRVMAPNLSIQVKFHQKNI
jgi:hypothetical protein